MARKKGWQDRVSICHGWLDFVVKRTVKTLAGLTPSEADRALAYEGSASLRELVRKLAARKLGKAATATLKLRALLADCEAVTQQRNALIHSLYAREPEGDVMLISHDDKRTPIPKAAELEDLAARIWALAVTINNSRLDGGFVFEALMQQSGVAQADAAKQAYAVLVAGRATAVAPLSFQLKGPSFRRLASCASSAIALSPSKQTAPSASLAQPLASCAVARHVLARRTLPHLRRHACVVRA